MINVKSPLKQHKVISQDFEEEFNSVLGSGIKGIGVRYMIKMGRYWKGTSGIAECRASKVLFSKINGRTE